MAMSFRLVLDPIACDGRGVCADLLPERIDLDDWGYPIIDPKPMAGVVVEHARRAVAACPVLALKLEAVTDRAPNRR
jgi:ferredoxin